MDLQPLILLTNDDGVHALGLWHLWHAIRRHAKVVIAAPATDQSGTATSLTLRSPLHANKVRWEEDTECYSITGTPADCVKMALSALLPKKPDLILSGINLGSNAGGNVLYSGTCGACIEGTLQNIPSIAFSSCDWNPAAFEWTEAHIPSIVQFFMKLQIPKGTFLNVNFPKEKDFSSPEWAFTTQGKQMLQEDFCKRTHPTWGHHYYWMGAKLSTTQEQENSDVYQLDKGRIAITPVKIGDLTDCEYLSLLQKQTNPEQIEVLQQNLI